MKNRIALVTGGIGDIGTALCRHFTTLGARVVAVDRVDKEKAEQWQQTQKQAGFSIEYAYADLLNFASCAHMAEDVQKRIGPVDILVNNAGINRDALFRKMTEEQWHAVIDTDLNALFNVTRQLINTMCDRHYGRIVNISSVSAQLGQFGQTNYAAAKSGVHGFTKSLAREVGKHGVTVNTVSPGFIESKMVKGIPDHVLQDIILQIPVGRLGKPEEIAWAVAFLAADESEFITGSNLSINGGIYML